MPENQHPALRDADYGIRGFVFADPMGILSTSDSRTKPLAINLAGTICSSGTQSSAASNPPPRRVRYEASPCRFIADALLMRI
ncbi:MAG: hypothetical protein ABI206_07230 [Antricoccus sp.]